MFIRKQKQSICEVSTTRVPESESQVVRLPPPLPTCRPPQTMDILGFGLPKECFAVPFQAKTCPFDNWTFFCVCKSNGLIL